MVQQNKKIDLSQSIEKAKEFWKGLITKSIEELLTTIESRNGHGGEFAKMKIELEKMKEDIIYDETDLEKEKILNLKIENRKFWKIFLLVPFYVESFHS